MDWELMTWGIGAYAVIATIFVIALATQEDRRCKREKESAEQHEAALVEWEGRYGGVWKSAQEANAERYKLRTEIGKLNAVLSDEVKKHEATAASLKETEEWLESSKGREAKLESDLAAAKAWADKDGAELHKTIARQKERIEKLEEEIEKWQSGADQGVRTIDTLRKERGDALAEVGKLNNLLDTVKAQKTAALERVERLERLSADAIRALTRDVGQ